MRGPVSPDGHLASHPNDGERMTMVFPSHVFGAQHERILDSLQDPGSKAVGVQTRSTVGQIGGDIVQTDAALTYPGADGTELTAIPVEIASYTKAAKDLSDDLNELNSATKDGELIRYNGRPLGIGRLIDLAQLKPLDAEEVTQNVHDAIIGFTSEDYEGRNFRVDTNGVLEVKLAPVEFFFDEEFLFGPLASSVGLLHEGRARLAGLSDAEDRHPNDKLPGFTLGGIRISPGPLHYMIEPKLRADGVERDEFIQIPGAAFIDGNRIMGIGDNLPTYDRHRQVELVRTASPSGGDLESAHTFGNSSVGMKIFRSRQLASSGAINWLRMPKADRLATHYGGVNVLRALDAANPANHEALLEVTDDPDNVALVMSRNGARVIGARRSQAQNERKISDVLARSEPGFDEGLEHLEPLVEALGSNAGDRTNILVTDEIDLSDIPHYAKNNDVRGFLFRKAKNGRTMDTNTQTMLAEYARRGIGIARVEGADYREFHQSGMFVKPGIAERLAKMELSVAVFGANRREVGTAYREDIEYLFDRMIEEFGGPEYLAAVHGGGDGAMGAAHKAALDRNMMSLAMMINLEKNAQQNVGNDASAVNEILSPELLTRQGILEACNLIPIFVPGGHGTFIEFFTSTTDRKLLHSLPTPLIVLNNNDYFTPLKEQVDIIANTTEIRRNGSTFNIAGKGNSPRTWVNYITHFVDSKEEVWDVIKNFKDDPAGVWHEAGVSREQLAVAYENMRAQAAKNGIGIPLFLSRAAERYIG